MWFGAVKIINQISVDTSVSERHAYRPIQILRYNIHLRLRLNIKTCFQILRELCKYINSYWLYQQKKWRIIRFINNDTFSDGFS